MRWRVPPHVTLIWTSWDEADEAVFNAASRQIHLLDALSAAALREIAAGAVTLPELARRLAEGYALDRGALEPRLVAICGEFDRIGLAEAAP